MKNNLPTTLYSIFFGKEVGTDNFGNKYYVHKKNTSKRWVLYKESVDPTAVSVDWQLWLNNNANEPPAKPEKIFSWQKSRLPNQTGSDEAYHPKSSKYIKNKEKQVNIDSKIWNPNNKNEK